MAQLCDETHDEIKRLSAVGDALAETDAFEAAREHYQRALDLLPHPKEDWDAWTWLQSSIGDTYYFEDDWAGCREAFRRAVAGPDALGNPFIHLRLGQCARELGDEDRALDELLRAYMGAGEDIFEGDAPSLEFLKSRVRL